MYNTMATMQKIEDAASTSSSRICRSSRLLARMMPSRSKRYAPPPRVSSVYASRYRCAKIPLHQADCCRGALNAAPAQRDHILHQHRLFHHEGLAVFRAHKVAIEPCDRPQSFADLLLIGKKCAAFGCDAVLGRITQQGRHATFELRRN